MLNGGRYNLLVGATRSGKSALLPIVISTVAQIFNRKIDVLITEPIQPMIRRVLFRQYIQPQNSLWKRVFPEGVLKVTEQFYVCNVANVYFGSVDNPERIEGLNYDLVALDELFQCAKAAIDIAFSRIAETSGYCYFSTTPYARQTWYRDWVDQKLQDPHWHVEHVTAQDAGVLSQEELERQKEELPAWLYRQRFLGDWRARPEGVIYNIDEVNIYSRMPDYWFSKFFAGLDFGESKGHPAGFVLFAETADGEIWAIDEFLKPCSGYTEYDKEIKNVLKRNGLDKHNVRIQADDARPGQIEALRRDCGYNIYPAKKGKILDGIARVQSVIRQGLKFVQPRVPNLLKEAAAYSFNDKTGKPYKSDDHIMDAMRYGLIRKNLDISAKGSYSVNDSQFDFSGL